jgi:hypothetical protein
MATKVEAAKEMIFIVLAVMYIVMFTIVAAVGAIVNIVVETARLIKYRNLDCDTDCDLYDNCINHEDCGDCIDYDKYIGSEDIK